MASSMDHQNPDLYQFLKVALEARQALMERHQALGLYNGFLEGEPRIAADLYGATLVLQNYAVRRRKANRSSKPPRRFICSTFPVHKNRIKRDKMSTSK